MTHDEAGALLDRIDACHDEDPAAAAALLRTLDIVALPEARRPSLAFLLNHVLGEKLSLWADAHERQQALLSLAEPTPVLLRQAAVAARQAGDAAEARSLTVALANASQADAVQAEQLVALAAASFAAPALPASAAGELSLRALQALESAAWSQPGPLDAAAAGACNNLASGLSERSAADLAHATVRAALDRAAQCSQRLWLRAGTWVHHERSCYLRALASQALGEPHRALEHAREGLALLDANDSAREQDVDRAFLELELAHACRRLGLQAEANAANERAQTLAAAFGDASLTQSFESRRAKLGTMLR
jgi:hypothetical protein